jgi:hypothetical protein
MATAAKILLPFVLFGGELFGSAVRLADAETPEWF